MSNRYNFFPDHTHPSCSLLSPYTKVPYLLTFFFQHSSFSGLLDSIIFTLPFICSLAAEGTEHVAQGIFLHYLTVYSMFLFQFKIVLFDYFLISFPASLPDHRSHFCPSCLSYRVKYRVNLYTLSA